MAAPVVEGSCPACGTEQGPYDLVCRACGTRIIHLACADETAHLLTIANLPPRMRELHDIANGAIAQAIAHLANAHRLGVRVDLAEDLLGMAKKAAVQGSFPVALDLASKSGEEAETQTIQFEALQNRVRAAKRAMDAAREDGADLRDSEELLEMANEASIAGDYKSALRYALKAAQRADRGRGRYQAWKVEISDFLK